MFKELTALDSKAHSSLSMNPDQPFTFAAHLMAAPVMAGEAELIAREYVLAFPAKPGLPLAILGVEQGRNAYVSPDGIWQARYLPAHIRRYPFMLAARPESADEQGGRNFTVMVDLAAPHFKFGTGQPLFTEDGQPAPALLNAQKFLIAIQNDSDRTQQLVQQLEEAQLLVQEPLIVRVADNPVSLDGLRVVNRQRLDGLPADTLKALQASGALQLVYAHFMSLTNLTNSVLVKGGGVSLDDDFTLPGMDDDTISFRWNN